MLSAPRLLSLLLALSAAAHAQTFRAGPPASARAPRPPSAAAPKPAAPDQSRASAERLRAEAESLRARWTVEAILRAVKAYEESARHWRAAGDAGMTARTLLDIGDSYASISMHREALAPYAEALALYRGAGDRRGEVEARNGVGAVYAFLGRNQEAEVYCRETLGLGATDPRLRAQALHNLGDVAYNLSRMEAALGHFRQALELWREAKDAAGEARTLTRVGYIRMGLSDMDEAEAAYNRALALWRASGDRRGLALNLTALGNLHNKLEEKQRALDFYFEAIQIFRPMGDAYGEATTLAGLAYVYERSGDEPAALAHYGRALELYRRAGHRLGEAVTLLVTGRIQNSLGDRRQALDNLRLALSVTQSLSDPLMTSYVLGHLGEVYDAEGDRRQALKYYEEALGLLRAGSDKRQEAYVLNNVGAVHRALGDPARAGRFFRDALELNRVARDPGGESLTRYNLARVALDAGDEEEAHRQIRAALDISESLRAKVAGQELRASYFASVQKQFDLYIGVLMRLHGRRPEARMDAAAFEASERRRARSLMEALAEGRAEIRQGVPAELLRQERELQVRLNAKAERLIQLGGGPAAAKESAAAEAELGALAAEYQQVQGRIRAASPRYAALVRPAPLTLAEIQGKVLDSDTVLLEYALGEERSHVWAVTQDSLRSFALPPRAEVERAARRVYELLTGRNRRVPGESWAQTQERLRRDEAEYEVASAALGRMLLGPVARELGRKRIAVVADGALQYVPFAALPEPDSPEAGQPSAPLIVGHEVVTLPSASVLALLREELRGRAPAPKAVAVLADPVFEKDDERLAPARAGGRAVAPARSGLRGFDGVGDGGEIARLPFSRREAEAIMASVPAGEGLLATGFRASRATATGPELAQYRVVHFATHGLLHSEHPELSGVVLSLFDEAGRRQDGFLQLHEVYNLNLPAELVVLSACQTALGKEVRGEGLIGLTRGFMYAGSPRVVASLWKVDDAATAELMGDFYRAMLGGGLRPAEALRAAQVQMWRRPQRRSPYYWAAFTLQGEWR